MKNIVKTSIISFFVFIAGTLVAQDVNEIIEKHIKAHGGIKKYEAIKSVKVTGQFTAFCIPKEFVTIKTSSGLYFSDFHLGKYRVKEAYNGDIAWTIDPWQDIEYPRRINKAEMNVYEQQAEILTPFFNYKEKGIKVEYIGTENVDGIDVYVLKITRPSDFSETWYLNAETFLEYKSESQWIDFAWPNPSEAYYDDFREVNGVLFPFYSERTFISRNRMYEIENIEVNIDIDHTIFDMPRSEEMLKLKFLEGNWNVRVDVWSRRGSWFRLDSVQSTIEYAGNNLLQEKISYERVFPISKTIYYSFNAESKKYRMTIYSDLSSSINVFEGEFNDTSFTTEKVILNVTDSAKQNLDYRQYFMYDINKDSFIVELKTSADNKTWNPSDKFTYTRRKD